ncbi:YvrJ family protein [Gracilibacillus caseinilyticus]|uniref:YvrJ family protein n=1 Tax=Gracilibacillus caseinilyticus TaxID=2932256 RepID=A0ABY4EZX9_9BACI|nr:YvrJ family protein [Gracilibacillus caseinilyticus]UOQ49413.1 YvrJ family protein [Gracilibacillus caseinilyticus]
MVVEMPQWILVLSNFGFPIAITIYLLTRFEKKLENLENVIIRLSDAIKEGKKNNE